MTQREKFQRVLDSVVGAFAFVLFGIAMFVVGRLSKKN